MQWLADKILKIIELSGISADWLFTGKEYSEDLLQYIEILKEKIRRDQKEYIFLLGQMQINTGGKHDENIHDS